MRTSERGIALIKDSEECELKAYLDAVGVWTIGYGHTGNVQPGAEITPDGAEEILKSDIETVEIWVGRLVTVPLNQNQFDALVSFVFNIGIGNFRKSSLLQFLNDGEYQEAADEFPKWNHGGGHVLPGLTKRRLRERLLFLDDPIERLDPLPVGTP